MIYTVPEEKIVTTLKTVEINAGEVWVNDFGYRMKIIDAGTDSLWCEWENGNKGSWKVNKFIDVGYVKED